MDKDFSEGFCKDIADILDGCKRHKTDNCDISLEFPSGFLNMHIVFSATPRRCPMNDEMATTVELREIRRLIHDATGYRILTRNEVRQIAMILDHAVDREFANAEIEQEVASDVKVYRQ